MIILQCNHSILIGLKKYKNRHVVQFNNEQKIKKPITQQLNGIEKNIVYLHKQTQPAINQ